MGRHHHQLRLPEHLYLSPPPPPNPSSSLASFSLLAAKSAGIYFASSPSLFQETGRSKAFAVRDRIPGLKISAGEQATIALLDNGMQSARSDRLILKQLSSPLSEQTSSSIST